MGSNSIPKTFNLLRWFSIACLVVLLPVAFATGYVLSNFITNETLQRDAAMTAQFIQNCVTVEGRHSNLGSHVTFADLLDRRVNPAVYGVSLEVAEAGRQEVLDHLQSLPDTLLANLFARDGRIIWSTNKALVGMVSTDNEELEEAFQSQVQVSRHHATTSSEREEQKFIVEPKEFFIENYIPLYNASGEVVLVAEIYKEPSNLVAVIKRGQYMVWGSTAVAGVLIYLFLFSIIRRGSSLLEDQQKQLVELDAMAYVGEMATAVAHSLRSPLASIRSSAELALDTDAPLVQKNAQDIIKQVDFLSRWVREMLVFTRPVSGEPEPVNLVVVMREVLDSFAGQMAAAGVRVAWERAEDNLPKVEGNAALVKQALHSVLANAIEAMPKGGALEIAVGLQPDRQRCSLAIRDNGIGMSEKQLKLAFKPFQTTKRQGLGVGLAMVKRVMERFGGSVVLSSQENRGTEVRLEFRLARG
jgi:signal transduction histidine kinase